MGVPFTEVKHRMCDRCGVRPSTRGLLDHKQMHGKNDRMCDKCNAGSFTVPGLRGHKIIHASKHRRCDKYNE